MNDESIDMLLDETTVIDSDSGSTTRDSISVQEAKENEYFRDGRGRATRLSAAPSSRGNVFHGAG